MFASVLLMLADRWHGSVWQCTSTLQLTVWPHVCMCLYVMWLTVRRSVHCVWWELRWTTVDEWLVSDIHRCSLLLLRRLLSSRRGFSNNWWWFLSHCNALLCYCCSLSIVEGLIFCSLAFLYYQLSNSIRPPGDCLRLWFMIYDYVRVINFLMMMMIIIILCFLLLWAGQRHCVLRLSVSKWVSVYAFRHDCILEVC